MMSFLYSSYLSFHFGDIGSITGFLGVFLLFFAEVIFLRLVEFEVIGNCLFVVVEVESFESISICSLVLFLPRFVELSLFSFFGSFSLFSSGWSLLSGLISIAFES